MKSMTHPSQESEMPKTGTAFVWKDRAPHDYDHDDTHRHHHDADTGEAVWWENADLFGGDFREHRHDHAESQSEPRTEAGKLLLAELGFTRWSVGGFRNRIDAIEEQAATEARRELLAKVEANRPRHGATHEYAEGYNNGVAATIALIEGAP